MSAKPEPVSENPEAAVSSRRKSLAVAVIVLTAMLILAAGAVWWHRNAAMQLPDGSVYQTEFQIMGTVAKVAVYAEKDLNPAVKLCMDEFSAVNRTCSLYNSDSELFRLNASAAEEPFACSDMMWELLMRSREAYDESDGNFDITVKPLMDLWGFYRKKAGNPPDDDEIVNVMKRVGFNRLIFDEKARTVFFSVPGMALDLGGIAKGYAVDRAAAKLKAHGIDAGVIDLGGNLRLLSGLPAGRTSYRVAIRDPHNRGKVLDEVLEISPDRSVSTSGDYERFVVFKGRRYGHIISPKTGRPQTICAVTVVADNAVDADVFSTSCCIGGEMVAEKIQAKYPNVEIYFTR